MFGMVARYVRQRAFAMHLDALTMGNVVDRGIYIGQSKKHRSRAICIRLLLSMVRAGGRMSVCSSPVYLEAKVEMTPISVAELKWIFAASERDEQWVIIQNRIIEGRKSEEGSDAETPLDYLNRKFAEEGPGITLSNCEIEGEINFVKHARPRSRVRNLLPEGTLDSLDKKLDLIGLRMSDVRLAVIRRSIHLSMCDVDGSIIAAFESFRQTAFTVFLNRISFTDSRCTKADFRLATFGEDTDFGGTEFSGEAVSFRLATFSENACFERATFSGEAWFRAATFSGEAYFTWARFRGEAISFGLAKFSGRVDFEQATFSGEAYFTWARFDAGLDAKQARFRQEATFSYALLKGDVDFKGADFQGSAAFDEARFAAGTVHVKTPVHFNLCTFRGQTDFTNARFQEPVIFSSSVIAGVFCFDNVRFEDNLNLSGVLLTESGSLSFVGARCEDIFFGVSKPTVSDEMKYGQTCAVQRAIKHAGNSLYEQLAPRSSVDLTGAFYSRLLFLEWSKLRPAVEQSLRKMRIGMRSPDAQKATQNPKGDGCPDDAVGNPAERVNAAIAALRLLAKNYQAVGSKTDALESYKFYREQRMKYQGTPLDTLIWLTTGFGARKERLIYRFLGLWLIPWALGYWRPGVVVAAKEGAEPPNDTLWNWVGTLGGEGWLQYPRMLAYSLWFSFNMFVPAIEVFGFKRWEPSNDKIVGIIPIRYYSLATLQRIMVGY